MSDGSVVGSAEFELRATKRKIQGDMEAARREIEEASKKTEASLAEIVGTGTAKGAKRGADAIKETGAAGVQAGDAIRDSMKKAGEEVASSISAGAQKAKAELDALARKAKEVQQIKLSVPSIPTEATHRLDTNPINGTQSWVPKGIGAPELQETTNGAKDLKEALDDVKPSADNVAGGLGGISRESLAAGASIAAIAGAAFLVATTMWEMGRAAMQSADDIANTARRIGIGTNALQEWRYVAKAAGGDARDADKALDSFATKLSQARAGTSKEAVKAFSFLNMGPEQLRGLGSTEMALDKVTDAIKGLKSEADRAAVAEALGLGGLSVALRDGAVDIANLRDEARELGVVMDANMIARASQAQSEFDTLSQIIDVNLKSAFIDMAPAIIGVINLVAQLARALGNAMDAFRDYEDKTERGLGAQNQSLRNKVTAAYRRPGGANGQLSPVQQGWERELAESDAEIARRARREIERSNRTTDRHDGATLALPTPRTPKARAARADRSEEREARRAERVEQEIFRARQRVLGIADEELMTVQERFDLAKKQVEMEREAEANELKSRLARKDITDENFKQLATIQKQTSTLEDRVASDVLARDLADERMANEHLLADLTADLVSLQIGAARSAGERLILERELLEITQKQRRETLQASLERNSSLTPEQRQRALDDNKRRDQMEQEAVARANMTPLQQWRDQSLKDAGEIAQAYESIAANGLDALNDGIVDAIMNSRDLGEVFNNVAKSIMADLAAIAVRKSITEPLANMLFGDGKSEEGGGGWLGKAASAIGGFFGGGRAFGGPVQGGMAYRVGEHGPETLMMPSNGYVVPDGAFSAGNTTNAPRSGGGDNYHINGNLLTPEWWAMIRGEISEGERRSNQWAATNVPGLAQSQTAKQQQNAVGRRRR